MPNYEIEVLSMPTGNTYDLIHKYFIYSCPSSRPNHQKPIFITFRKKHGGEMEYLYKIKYEKIVDFNKSEELEAIENSNLEYKSRLLEYIKELKLIYPDNAENKYYILDENDVIKLINKCKPRVNNVAFCYYKISEFMSGREIIVTENNQI